MNNNIISLDLGSEYFNYEQLETIKFLTSIYGNTDNFHFYARYGFFYILHHETAFALKFIIENLQVKFYLLDNLFTETVYEMLRILKRDIDRFNGITGAKG